jgi:hypothetical protein
VDISCDNGYVNVDFEPDNWVLIDKAGVRFRAQHSQVFVRHLPGWN